MGTVLVPHPISIIVYSLKKAPLILKTKGANSLFKEYIY